MQRLEEETRANGYIVKERLPKDVSTRKKAVQDLQKVVAVPAMGQSDLEDLQNQVHTFPLLSHHVGFEGGPRILKKGRVFGPLGPP